MQRHFHHGLLMSGTQGFGEHGAFTVTVAGDPRLVETVNELTRKAAEMAGCSSSDAAGLAEALSAVAKAVGNDVDLAYRPTPSALVVEVRPTQRGAGASSMHALLAKSDAFARIKKLVPAAELQGTGSDECCFLMAPRAGALPA
jgi:hypothetical protein